MSEVRGPRPHLIWELDGVVASVIGCSFWGGADSRCGEQSANVLNHRPLRLQGFDRGGHVRPEPRPRVESQTHLPTVETS